MTISEVETRLAQHKAARDQAIANIHALDGAIQEATYWLEQLKSEEPAHE